MHPDRIVSGHCIGGNYRIECSDAIGPGSLVLHYHLRRPAPVEVDVSQHSLQQRVVLNVCDGGVHSHGRACYDNESAGCSFHDEFGLYSSVVDGIVLDLEVIAAGRGVLSKIEKYPEIVHPGADTRGHLETEVVATGSVVDPARSQTVDHRRGRGAIGSRREV